MNARSPYLLACLGLAGLCAVAMSGDVLPMLAVVFLVWLVLSIVGWEAAHR